MIVQDDIIIPDTRYLPILEKCINNLEKWGFVFDAKSLIWDIDNISSMGRTSWALENGKVQVTITFNRALISQDEEVIEDTIYHELAHYIAGYKAAHGKRWLEVISVIRKHTGLKLGVTQNAGELSDVFFFMGFKYVLQCDKCGLTVGFNELTNAVKNPKEINPANGEFRFSCKQCGGTWSRLR